MRELRRGKSITELAQEVERRENAKRDFVAPGSDLLMEIVESTQEKRDAQLKVGGSIDESFGLNEHAHAQIATRTGIPKRYYDRMREQDPNLLQTNVNHWLHEGETKHLFRTLDGVGRAFLSDSYRALDHFDLLNATIPVFHDIPGLKVLSSEITDRRMYVKLVIPSIKAEVGDPKAHRFYEFVAGLLLKNSEVGLGYYEVVGLKCGTFCWNTSMHGAQFKKAHLGARSGADEAQEYWSDETRALDNAALFSKTRDVVKGILNEEAFKTEIARLNESFDVPSVKDPVGAMEVVKKRFELNDSETLGIRTALFEQASDFGTGKFGLFNAFTEFAKDTSLDYDRAVELESMAGKLTELPRKEWTQIAENVSA